MVIGIPNGMYTNTSKLMYKFFFSNLGLKVIFSGNTTKEIKDNGIKYSIDEACLASKIFIGHVDRLVKLYEKGEINYIFIPRLCSYDKTETECVRFYAMYDIYKNLFNAKFLTLNIDYNDKSSEMEAYIKLAHDLGFSKIKGYLSYINAKKMFKRRYEENKKFELRNYNKNNKKVLIVAHPYVYDDEILGRPICKYLKSQNLDLIYASKENAKNNLYKNISKTLFWKQSKSLMNGLIKNKDTVDGIIYMSVFPCGTDSLTTELMQRKIKNIPSINLIIDEETGFEGYKTRLESFIDIINV